MAVTNVLSGLGLLGEGNPDAQRLSYEELQQLRAIEARKAAQGVDTSPVQAWTQGLARVANALAGSVRRGQLEQAESERSAWANDLISGALTGSGGATTSTASPQVGAAPQDAASSASSAAAVPVDTASPVYGDFMTGVQQGGLTNPYALAAVAATGNHESRFSPQNANRTWSDPSQSGQAGTAGGVMSWRNDRLQNLYNFAAQRGEKPGAISPATQAAFFIAENPALTQKLQGAQSLEEAQGLMNGAWRFAGYNQPGGEAAARLATAQRLLPQFQRSGGGGVPTPATNDLVYRGELNGLPPDQLVQQAPYRPQPGMNPETMVQPLAQPGRVQLAGGDPSTDQSALLMALAQRGGAVQGAPGQQAITAALSPGNATPRQSQIGGTQPTMAPPAAGAGPAATSPQQVAQAPAALTPGQQTVSNALMGADPKLVAGMMSGRLSPNEQRIAQILVQQQMQQNDPMRKLQMEQMQLQNEKLRNPRRELINAGEGRLYDPNSGQWITAPNSMAAPTTTEAYDPETGQPVRMQWNRATGSWDMLGGAKKAAPKAVPAAVQKAEADDLTDIQTLGSINDTLGGFASQIEGGKLSLGPVQNVISGAQNWLGTSDENSRNFASFQAGLEKLRNDSLRLNKGVQTEGDAERAWNELDANINDPKVVQQRLGEIQELNRKAIQFKYGLIDNRRSMNGLDPLDTGSIVTSPAGRQAPGAAPGAGQGTGGPPPAAINALRQNPALRDQFDAKYGNGASARALGQ